VSAAAGRLPTFFVIGAGKAATTSFHYYLAQHPQIFMCPLKEPKFFALEGHALDFRGPGDERIREGTVTELGAYRRLFAGVRGERAVGESSTLYLNDAGAAERIARHVPGARMIAILRDPADRAHSAFLHLTRDGFEPEADFAAALRDEPRRRAAGWYFYWFYRDRGYYHRDLRRYVSLFGRQAVRVYLYDDFDRAPHTVLADAFAFLGVDPAFRPDVAARHNVSGRPRSAAAQRWLRRRHPLKEALKAWVPERLGHRLISALQSLNLERPRLGPETRADLVAGYRDDILALEGLIGRDLAAWRRS
jgi:hypothetical protein